MRAAVLTDFGTPAVGDFNEPEPTTGSTVIEVLAAGIHHVDLLKASGRFYTGPPPLPSVVGSDGVGRTPDGRLVYFDEPTPPFGSLAERALVRDDCVMLAVPDVDPAVLAALGNAGLAAHTALQWRGNVQPGESVLVLGATGVVGRLTVQVARLLGAGRVVAAGRDHEGLTRARELGADEAVELGPQLDPVTLGGANVIVDLLWGAPAAAALAHAAHGVRLIQLGQLSAVETPLAAPVLRGRAADIRAHAVFHAPYDVRAAAYRWLGEAAAASRLHVDVERVSLSDVTQAWSRQAAGTRGVKQVIVF